MTGRERIEAAFSPEGTPELGVVIPYEGILIRDHWDELSSAPWWHVYSPDLDVQQAWRARVIETLGQDWFALPGCASRKDREKLTIEERADGAWQVDLPTGRAHRLPERRVSDIPDADVVLSHRPARLAATADEIDETIPEPDPAGVDDLVESGQCDLARRMLDAYGDRLCPIEHVSSPLWMCYGLWGFEGLMTTLAESPELVAHACARYLAHAREAVRAAARRGAAVVFIEECMTDMMGPDAFARLNVPPMRELVETIRAEGMRSVYYYCGNPAGKWDALLSIGADGLSLEEGKKGFSIDIGEVAELVDGRCTLLGNLDAIGVLQDGSDDELRGALAAQVAAGRRNGSRFVVCLGSPVTPRTPVARVRQYCETARELGRR